MSDPLMSSAKELAAAASRALQDADTVPALLEVKARHLGKDADLTALVGTIPSLPIEERRVAGRAINEAKQQVEALFAARLQILKDAALAPTMSIDVTLPGRLGWVGHLHPVTLAWREITDIFTGMGYSIEEGPEVEHDWHNFEALNMPQGHPAREMQDTFYLDDQVVLRTHTSPVQVRTMLRQPPPVRMICPGTVYRRDNDVTHSPMFHQIEGLVVDERATMAELKGTLAEFARAFFGPQARIRFRASFFPFTEPSAELDVSCVFCSGGPCRVCKGSRWLEVGGAGMVDPAVFQTLHRAEYDPQIVRGFAFGMGIDRLAMLRFGIDDLRLLFENDIRFLESF